MRNSKKVNIRALTATALGTAAISVCALIGLPPLFGAAPFTLQSFAVLLCAGILGKYYGSASVLVYIALGAVGAPVFAGLRGGLGIFMEATGGYIIGFLPCAFIAGIICEAGKRKFSFCLLGMSAGTLICYAVGTVWFVFVYGGGSAGFMSAFTVCVAPYILPDIVKIVLAAVVCRRVKVSLIKKG